jgi:predicted DCC family thiol-disulfide oxidoreductase YuxK
MTARRYTLLYDGACRICTNQVQTVADYNDADLIELVDMNAPEVRERFPQIHPQDTQRTMHLVAPDGTIYRGAEAVRETLLHLPALRGLGELMRLPGAMLFAQPVYEWVARNRYWLGGRNDHCIDGSCVRPE